jgi:hypothetical protein
MGTPPKGSAFIGCFVTQIEFERWWSGVYFMNQSEIRWIVENLFIGNKLTRGDAFLNDGTPVDLTRIRKPLAGLDIENLAVNGHRIPKFRESGRLSAPSTCDSPRSVFARSDWTSAANGAVLSSTLRR